MPVKAPVYKAPVIVAPSWTGFYIGANVGGGWGSRDVDYTGNDVASTTLLVALGSQPAPTAIKTSGVLGGLQLGYNWQVAPTWLVGLETDFDWSGMKGSGTSNATPLGFPYSATADERIKWFGTVRARLGYLPANNLLAYVTGGFAYGRVEHTASYNNNSPTSLIIVAVPFVTCAPNTACYAGSSSSTATGWTLGGGLEYAVAHNWTVKAEYLYVRLGGGNSLTETAFISSGSSLNANFSRTDFNVARVGVNYRF